jgi:hypothetical protein
VAGTALPLWAAAVWALLPVATGAVAAGRLDAAAVQVLLPLLGLALVRLLREDPSGAWHRAWGTGLLLALTVALAPTLALVAAPLLLAAGLVGLLGAVGLARGRRASARRRGLAALVVVAVPAALLLPWWLEAVRDPGLVLHGPGRLALDPALADPSLPSWHLLLLSPGGAGVPPLWVTAGLLVAGLAGLLRVTRRRTARAGWAIALLGLLGALVLARTTASVPGEGGGPLPVWPGVPLQAAAAGLLLAALVAGDGLRERLAGVDFGWRQLTAAVVAAAAAGVPLLAGGAWVVRGADDPLDRRVDVVLPAFVTAELQEEPGLRVLVLRPLADDVLGYELSTGDGVRLGTADLPVPEGQARALDDVVADLVTPRGSAAAGALGTRAVRYVALPAEAAGSAVVAALDAQDGLSRRSDDPVLLWRVETPVARLQVLSPRLADGALSGRTGPDADALRASPPTPIDADPAGVLPAGPADRLLVLAEARDGRWRATLDGRRLEPATAWGWAQAFALPVEGGRLVVEHDDEDRATTVALQAAGLVLLAVLAVPGARRRSGLEPADDDDGAAEPTPSVPADAPEQVRA